MVRRPTPRWPIVTATAHRPEKIPNLPWAREKITNCVRWLYDECGTRDFICGMARGGDLMFGAAALAAGMTLWAYIPCEDQTRKWSRADVAEWQRLRAAADQSRERVFAAAYRPAAMFERNEGMLAAADAVICLWDPSQRAGSGTFHAVRRAHDMKMAGMHLDPRACTVRWDVPTP